MLGVNIIGSMTSSFRLWCLKNGETFPDKGMVVNWLNFEADLADADADVSLVISKKELSEAIWEEINKQQ